MIAHRGTAAIDTLRYAKRLKAVGFTDEQADVQAEALSDAVSETLATKADVNEAVERLRIEMRDLANNLIRWLIPLLFAELAAIVALVKLL